MTPGPEHFHEFSDFGSVRSMVRIVVEVESDIRELIPEFLRNRRHDVTALYEALAASDLHEVARIAHGLKGVGGGFGFDRVSELGRKIEMAAKNDARSTVSGLTEELSSYLDRVEIVYVD